MPYSLKDALMGGPGLDGYAYNADVYCVPCGRDIIRAVFREHAEANAGSEILSDLEFGDSETCPQPIFFGESPDCAQHCGDCGEYLYGESPEDGE
jgi:hypothetical protein